MVGQTLAHYVIEAKLGQGGMGVVYRARDTRLGRPVALKVLAREVMGDPERRRRFVREAQAAAAVTHPAIAQIYAVDEADGITFIAMELVEGRTVRQLIAAGEMDVLKAMDVAIQVGGGLAKAHDAGIVHRDIKSDNVMVTPDGQAKLLDFGLAKLLDPQDSGDGSEMLTRGASSAATQAGMVLGTLAYMSPEQARGKGVDQRSDIFSLGVMLYEMATGQLPFAGDSALDTMHAIAFEEARPVTQIRPGLPPDLQRIVSRCLRKQPEDLYQATREVIEDLSRLRHDTETGSLPALSMVSRLQQRLPDLGRWRSAAGPVWVTATLVLVVLVVLLLASEKGRLGTLVFFGLVGLFAWRRLRNRRRRLLGKAVAKLRKSPEVRMICLHDNNVAIVVDQAQAAMYARVHDMVERINHKLYFGDPLTGSVREDVTPAELSQWLRRPGVLYVRADVARSGTQAS
jgi:tRNA A-37 threonylcarbamoyl transferase component Bud32